MAEQRQLAVQAPMMPGLEATRETQGWRRCVLAQEAACAQEEPAAAAPAAAARTVAACGVATQEATESCQQKSLAAASLGWGAAAAAGLGTPLGTSVVILVAIAYGNDQCGSLIHISLSMSSSPSLRPANRDVACTRSHVETRYKHDDAGWQGSFSHESLIRRGAKGKNMTQQSLHASGT